MAGASALLPGNTLYERSPKANGVEIYNGLIDFAQGTALATEKWDYLLSRNRLLLGFANDNAHSLPHIGQAWMMVRSAARTPRAVYKAIFDGNFYCSTGGQLTDIRRKGTRVTVTSPDAQEIWAVGEFGARMARVYGKKMEFDFATIASPHARYVRFVAFGKGAGIAFTQPFIREPIIDDKRCSPFVANWNVSSLLLQPLDTVTAADADKPGLAWKPVKAIVAPDGFVNVSSVHGQNHGVALLSARVSVSKPGRWIAALGHDGGARLFVDGRQVIDQPKRMNPAVPDRSRAALNLSKGEHRILVALNTDHGKGQGIFLRFIHPGIPKQTPAFPKEA